MTPRLRDPVEMYAWNMTEPRPVAKGLRFLVRCHTKENSNVSKSVLPLNGVSRKKKTLSPNKRNSLLGKYRRLFSMVVCSLHKTTKIWVCVNLVWYGNVAVPWLRLLHSGCSPRRPRFSPSQVHLGFVVDKVALPSITLVSPLSCQHTITPRPYFHPSRLCINSETHMSLSTPLTNR
jgi:hypothetical protein